MVSIIKNQLLKHLSRYTKNLSSDKINLSTFRGEGELSNLQLDENVLTELLELPSWLRLTSAWCNHVAFRIHWTKLKSVPITLSLDEVNISVETCEFGRTGGGPATPGLQALTAPQGKYSFIHKVIDGITIIVNTVNVNFKSPAFTASVQMSRIRVESKTPKWLLGDLRVTRLKDPTRGLLLIFKELSWQTVRIEASSTQDESLTPLRLLTNQASCRITIKKRLSDCNVLNCRLVLILDDLLWVLTDSQLKAALHFVDSLSGLIKTSTNANQKTKAQKKLEMLPEYQAQIAQQSRSTDATGAQTTAQKSFNLFDVRETSYHFFSQRIDLHLCDDPGDGRSCHPDLSDGGALQISVQGFQVDYYPYHLAKASRVHWPKYKEASTPTALWLEQSLNKFRESLLDLYQPNRPSSHAPLERTSNSPPSRDSVTMQESPVKKQVLDNLSKLMSACVILRIEDFTLYRVTTSGKKQMPKEFISAQQKRKLRTGDKDRYSFPTELSAVHAEFTYFYYPGDFVFPLPPSKIFVHVNPVQIHFDVDSLLWLSSFGLNLHNSLMRTSVVDSINASSPSGVNEPSLMYMDVKMEAILPRIVFESSVDAPSQRDRPKIMQVQISRASVTNIREMGTSRADLAQALHSLQEGSLVFSSGFPSKEGDLCIVTDRILSHVAASDVTPTGASQPGSPQSNTSGSILSRHALWTEPRDVWCVKLDPIWIEFYGARSVGVNKAIPFLDAVPVTLWLHGKSQADTKILPFDADTTVRNHRKVQKEPAIQSLSDLRQSSTDCGSYLMPNVQEDFYSSQQHSINPFHQQQSFDSTYSSTLRSQNADCSGDEKSADLHVIAHVSNLVSLQIDHYQFLFILRLAEEITELSTFLSLDTKRIMAEKATTNSIIVGCVVPQVEVTLVMPSQTPGKESTGGDGESVVPDSASLGTNTAWPSLDHTKSMNPFSSVESPSPTELIEPQDGFHHSNPNTHGYNVQIQSQPTSSQPIPPSPSAKTELLSSMKGGRNRNSVSDTSFTKEINTGILSIKKGFSNMMTSIDSALKVGTDDASDTFSIHSDLSSDSENYIMVEGTADCMDVMFRLNPFATDNNLKASPVEMASEVCEEQSGAYKTNISSPSEPSEASIWRRRDLVSMATFRLTTVEIIRQNQGSNSSLRLQVAAVSCDECGAIPWDELQTGHQTTKTKFGARCRAWNMAPYNPESPPSIQVRLEEELNTPEDIQSGIKDKKNVLSWFTHKVDVLVKDLTMQLSMSTVIGLNDLCEDEVIPRPLPMDIIVENVRLNLIEDRPPVNITSPGPIPINLAIGKMKIERDKSGIFYIQPESSYTHRGEAEMPQTTRKERDREVISLQLILQQLKMDNESLKKQLNSAEKTSESNQMRARQENEVLKTYLKAAQDDITTLLDEKRTLLDTVRSLQQQLTQAETNKNVGNR
ncbi:bridge-like lipid transfer protein family member 3B isoform X2 [Phlebotomus argentipes]|uniref:bridge-like lipid transfer protein family member 3B isoform X2 n=1 Tax=Phlebotomus argentipes TaxID=94469 RepID=UPI0028937628|nr:bridge-like lipid transfer protein family member 3B isoform X2 [Phlebotomus argentipes]